MDEAPNLLEQATKVLANNNQGDYTIPAEQLYPHQWLWDSCFISIGLRHIDIDRAKREILSLLKGQWHNGMVPNMVFNIENAYQRDRSVWRSWLNPDAPDSVATSGITQPPMLAESIVQIGKSLPKSERHSWYRQVFPSLLAYHSWLMTDRDPAKEGLVTLIHPYETGLDSTPPWLHELHLHHKPWWVRSIEITHTQFVINLFRRDTHKISSSQRMDAIEALMYFSIIAKLRRKNYNSAKILKHSYLAIQDLTFNAILVRANQHLVTIADQIRETIPDEIEAAIERNQKSIELLWDPYSNCYFSRSYRSKKLIKIPSIAALMPLYAGSISKERAKLLVKSLENEKAFGSPYPIPSVPLDSTWFNPVKYWQGPSWINTNWLIIDGLKRYGFTDHAAALRESTLEMIKRAGLYEYFNPLDGSAAGAKNFSWTAALAIDLLKQKD